MRVCMILNAILRRTSAPILRPNGGRLSQDVTSKFRLITARMNIKKTAVQTAARLVETDLSVGLGCDLEECVHVLRHSQKYI